MKMESLSAYHFAAVNATYKSATHAYYEIKIYMCMYNVIEWRCIYIINVYLIMLLSFDHTLTLMSLPQDTKRCKRVLTSRPAIGSV